ncbi:MAG: hybrid sensor histidine kinase/response regulator [Cyanobacteria bacterium P01_F01_bin.53]
MSELLIVDDTLTNLHLLMELMSGQGYSVRTATSGPMALESVQVSAPDLILLDINMPHMDGYEVCRQLKANPKTKAIPVIFLSALSTTLDKVKAFEVGGIDYVTKPFHMEEILIRVKTQLSLRQMRSQLEEQLKTRSNQLNQTQLQLLQQEKMASLGTLVAGIAHELNNPIGFLSGSVRNAQRFLQDVFSHLDLYEETYPQANGSIQEHAEDIDLEFLRDDFPKLLNSMYGAMERIRSISTSLRIFSRSDTEHKTSASLIEGLDSTLLILKYRLKSNDNRPKITVEKDYSELPEIECFPGQLNQVFMNILANAIDVFDEAAHQLSESELAANPQTIKIQTALLTDQQMAQMAEIRISDNGKGMNAEVKARIFDHLFTTKGVGKGTGLGLAIAHQIITEAHGGTLTVTSEPGQGSEFCIRVPITTLEIATSEM